MEFGRPYTVTATGAVYPRRGMVLGYVVTTSASLTLRLHDNASAASGTEVLPTTPAFTAGGTFYRLPVSLANGLYATVGGTGSVTFYIVDAA